MAFKVVGVGEVLWDLLLSGPQLGGAPANFAYHAHALGAQAEVITRVGNDVYGQEIIRRFEGMDLPGGSVQTDPSLPTGVAKVTLSRKGLPQFTIQENVAWDHIALTEEALGSSRTADAICFGSLAQRSDTSRQTIRQLVASTPAVALKVFDINLRQHFYSNDVIAESLRMANILKLNNDELPILARMFNLADSNGNDIEAQIKSLAHTFQLDWLALTRGANGSLLYQAIGREPRWSDCVSRPVDVVDTVGAGDSFTAAFVLGLLLKVDLDEINSIANEVARYVCSQPGATPPLPPEFARKLRAASPA